MKVKKKQALGVVIGVLCCLATRATADVLYVANSASANAGLITEFDTNLDVVGSILLPGVIGVAVGPAGHVYADDATHVYDFSTNGQLLNTFTPSDPFVHFGDLSFSGQTLYVANSSSPNAGLITEFGTDLGVVGSILLPGVIGVAVGPTGHLYADNVTNVYDFSTNGQLLNTFTPSDPFVHFGGLSFSAGEVSSVPEPASVALLISVLIGCFGFKLRH